MQAPKYVIGEHVAYELTEGEVQMATIEAATLRPDGWNYRTTPTTGFYRDKTNSFHEDKVVFKRSQSGTRWISTNGTGTQGIRV